MRSTGEVMGIDSSFGLAFSKSQLAAGDNLPDGGTVFFSVADRSKRAGLEAATRFVAAGFTIAATAGTAQYLEQAGVLVGTLVAKVLAPENAAAETGERDLADAVDAVELIRSGKVQLVVNTPRGRGSRADGAYIRRAARQTPPPGDDRGRGPGRRQPACSSGPAGLLPSSQSRNTTGTTDAGRPTRATGEGCPSPWAGRRFGRRCNGRYGRAHAVQVCARTLPNSLMTASGTAGHGAELGACFDLSRLGVIVVKSLSLAPWAGNRAPRLLPAGGGMLNSVGLQNPGVEAWLATDLPALAATGARVVVSVWGRSVGDYADVGARLASALGRRPHPVVAVEANVSCPNVEDRDRIFAHSAETTSAVIGTLAGAEAPADLPVWAKLSPNVTDLVAIAGAALGAGAGGLTLVNTLMGLALDPATGRPMLGGGGGGLSGPALHPVAVRAVFECRPSVPGRRHRWRRRREQRL